MTETGEITEQELETGRKLFLKPCEFIAASTAISNLPPMDGPLEALQQQLPTWLALGASLMEPARQEPFGAEVWLADPEGNPVLMVQPFPRAST